MAAAESSSRIRKSERARAHALYLIIKRISFLSKSRLPVSRCVGAAQLFQCLLDGKFGCFGHGKPRAENALGA
ncbi:hypothetical protein LMTR3_09340 [Bradyrhizobium sp. LMTR 3]|nr:hypothetical protein LMTR3_09340 [Bradyrhizobium sp. LMTR 3]